MSIPKYSEKYVCPECGKTDAKCNGLDYDDQLSFDCSSCGHQWYEREIIVKARCYDENDESTEYTQPEKMLADVFKSIESKNYRDAIVDLDRITSAYQMRLLQVDDMNQLDMAIGYVLKLKGDCYANVEGKNPIQYGGNAYVWYSHAAGAQNVECLPILWKSALEAKALGEAYSFLTTSAAEANAEAVHILATIREKEGYEDIMTISDQLGWLSTLSLAKPEMIEQLEKDTERLSKELEKSSEL